jgi:hypothetical protein
VAEKSAFFDSTIEDPREYTAEDFADYFKIFTGNGVVSGGSQLQVVPEGGTMRTKITPGYAWIEGYAYKNDSDLFLTHDPADAQYDRIDRVVLRLDLSLGVRAINAKVLKGEPSATPIAPALTRSGNIYEISLATVRIIAGKSYIEATEISDERSDDVVCGIIERNTREVPQVFNVYRLNKDVNGVFREVQYKRTNGTLWKKSVLSNPDAKGNYQTQTITYYSSDGVTITGTETWSITYDEEGDVVSEVKV